MHIFTTEAVADLLDMEPWRVTKFTQSKEYGIVPSLADAKGSGSRRLYNLEDVCQIGLALRLLETGLRSNAIGKVIRQLRQKGKLSGRLWSATADTILVIFRTPEIGRPLNERRQQTVEFIATKEEVLIMAKKRPDDDLILVPLGPFFAQLKQKLSAD